MCKKAIVAFIALAAVAAADEITKKTVIRLNEPVMVAGVPVVTLEPGTYQIRLMNHDHNRNIVQFFNERGDKLFTTVLAIPNYRLEPPTKTEFRFWETPRGNPPALRAWFSPGDPYGQEFVYPKGLAARIARETGEPVLVTPVETVAALPTAPVAEVTKTGEEVPLEEAYTQPAKPAPVLIAEAAPGPEPEPAPEPEPLPATASPYFTFGLAGIFAAAAGFGLRKVAARHS
jgi:hypothetical protein